MPVYIEGLLSDNPVLPTRWAGMPALYAKYVKAVAGSVADRWASARRHIDPAITESFTFRISYVFSINWRVYTHPQTRLV